MAAQTALAKPAKEAKQIAHDYGMFVVEKPGRFLLYRKGTPRNVFLGYRSDPEAFRRFVAKVAGLN